MKNGKAPGADSISADVLQAEKALPFTILLKVFEKPVYPRTCLKIERLV